MLNRLFFTLLLGFPTLLLAQETWYVSTTGNDLLNPGTLALPLRTINYAMTQIEAGDTLVVRGGTYNEKITWGPSGTVLKPTILRPYTGETVIVDGTGVANPEAMLTIYNKSNVVVQGLTFTNNYRQDARGIHVYGEGEEVLIEGCTVRKIGFTDIPTTDPNGTTIGQAHGILVNGRTALGYTGVVINGCTLDSLITGNSEALTLVGNVSKFVVANNTLFNNTNIGIDIAGNYAWAVDMGVDSASNQARDGVVTGNFVYNHRRFNNDDAPPGLYADGAVNVVFANNVSSNNGVGMSVGCENPGKKAFKITLLNNVVYDNDNDGVVFGSNNGLIDSCVFRNNTVYINGSVQDFTAEVSLQNSTNCLIANNILYSNLLGHHALHIFGFTTSNLTVDHNLMFRTDNDVNLLIASGNGSPLPVTTNNVFLNPEFVNDDLFTPDFHLLETSPAIDAGLNTYVFTGELDADGNPRPSGLITDLGAFEFQVTPPLPVEYLVPLQATLRTDVVQLTWRTANEVNSDHFVVEKSANGARWTALGRVQAGQYNYQFTDAAPFVGRNYYRLRQVDLDGKINYSPVVTVNYRTAGGDLQVRPNPSAGPLNLQLNNSWRGTVTVVVTTAAGREVFSQRSEKTDDTWIWDGTLANVLPGTYVVQVQHAGGTAVARWIRD